MGLFFFVRNSLSSSSIENEMQHLMNKIKYIKRSKENIFLTKMLFFLSMLSGIICYV
jgi:hypothetical protein